MKARATVRPLPDTYFDRVREFPLVHIRNDAHLAAAQEVLDALLQEDMDVGSEAYLDALTDLVEVYEREHAALPDAPEADVLQELMAANRLSQSALAKQVGIAQSTISAILNGSRSMTRGQATALANHFGISASAFI